MMIPFFIANIFSAFQPIALSSFQYFMFNHEVTRLEIFNDVFYLYFFCCLLYVLFNIIWDFSENVESSQKSDKEIAEEKKSDTFDWFWRLFHRQTLTPPETNSSDQISTELKEVC